MSAVQKIEKLDQERVELKQQLKQKGISEAKEIAIRNQITAVGNEITSLNPAAEKELSHQRSVLESFVLEVQQNPASIGIPTLSAAAVATWTSARLYMQIRHQFAPYTAHQLVWREWMFRLKSPFPAGVQRVGLVSAFLLVLKGWTKAPPRH
jgi:hypothetical protein